MSAFNIAYVNSPTVPLAVTTSSGSVAYGVSADFIVIKNLGSTPAYIKSGTSAVTAVADTNWCVPGGQTETIRRDYKDTHIAAICATGSTTLSISSTEGR